ncbi:MAG: SMODS domain-containing nucleotidyltransferase [Bacillota bacterium]
MEQSKRVSLAVAHNQLAAGICSRYRGKVIKYIGDLIMVAFETPLEGILAALEFVEKINRDKLPFRTKSVITHGIVTRIDNGGIDYIGNAVDIGSRLIDHALPSQILTDEVTLEIIKPFIKDFDEMVSRFLGMRDLGKAGRVPVYELALVDTGFVNDDTLPKELQLDNPLSSVTDPAITPAPPKMEHPPLAAPQHIDAPVTDGLLSGVIKACTLSEAELNAIVLGYQNISHILEKAHDMHVKQASLSGSFARGTMIKPLSAVDIIAVMAPPTGQDQKVPETLDRLRQFLIKESPGTEVSVSRGRIGLGMQGIEYAITPVLATLDNGQVQLYIPSSEGGFWVSRNPALPEQWMKKAAEKHGPAFLTFLKIIKAWQKTNCSYIKDFHIELLTGKIASQVKLDLSFESVYQWFKHAYNLMSQNKKPFLTEPNRPDIFIDDYIYSNAVTFGRFGRILTESYNLAKQGIAYHRAGENKMALTRWKTLFGLYIEDIN